MSNSAQVMLYVAGETASWAIVVVEIVTVVVLFIQSARDGHSLLQSAVITDD